MSASSKHVYNSSIMGARSCFYVLCFNFLLSLFYWMQQKIEGL